MANALATAGAPPAITAAMSTFTTHLPDAPQSAALATTTASDALERASDGVPLAYRDGRQTFMGIQLLVDPGALVPRAETEVLGSTAVGVLTEMEPEGTGLTLIDMCCGSGNLGCGIAMALPRLRVLAADLTSGCVSLARRNVAHLALNDRMTVHQGNLFEAFQDISIQGQVDLVVCNPPYISSGRLERDRAALVRHEPREAFDGGPYGLSIHQRVIKEATEFLRPGGWLLCEFGLGQHDQVRRLLERARAYDQIGFVGYESGEDRVALARRIS